MTAYGEYSYPFIITSGKLAVVRVTINENNAVCFEPKYSGSTSLNSSYPMRPNISTTMETKLVHQQPMRPMKWIEIIESVKLN